MSSAPTEGQAIRVPLRFVNAAGNNRVKFDIEGRGQFGYAVTLTGFTREFGPDQDRANRPFGIHRRVYWADTPSLDGKPLAAGFSTAIHPQVFENTVTQTVLGGKVPISVEAWGDQPAGQPSVGGRLPGPEGIPPGRDDPRRGLRQFPGQPLHGRGRRPHSRPSRPTSLPAWSTRSTATRPGPTCLAAQPLQGRLRAGPSSSGRAGRAESPRSGREVDRSVPADPGRAIRPRQGPL